MSSKIPDFLSFPPLGLLNASLIITLAAGGASISGKLSILGHVVIE